MSDETLYDLRCYVSDCFNHRGYNFDGETLDVSGYQKLARLMIKEYDLDNNDVDNVVSDIEELIAQYIMEQSPKFNDDDDISTSKTTSPMWYRRCVYTILRSTFLEAATETGAAFELDPYQVLCFMVENKPMTGTHSYGFQS